MGADRGQLQAAARGQQPVPGQPHGQERGPERGGVRPRPVPAVEVHAQPAAVGEPARPHRPGPHAGRLSLVITLSIMFLEPSAKLYTSVFHHGLNVRELVRGTGPGWTAKRPGKRTTLLVPQEAARPPFRGRGRPHPQQPLGRPSRGPNADRWGAGRAEGVSLLRHREENSLEISIFDPIEITSGFHDTEPSHFAGLRRIPLSLLLCSQLSSQHRPPLPRDVLALFEYELFYGGTVNINIYKERMYGQFPMVSVGCPHLVNSPQSS